MLENTISFIESLIVKDSSNWENPSIIRPNVYLKPGEYADVFNAFFFQVGSKKVKKLTCIFFNFWKYLAWS